MVLPNSTQQSELQPQAEGVWPMTDVKPVSAGTITDEELREVLRGGGSMVVMMKHDETEEQFCRGMEYLRMISLWYLRILRHILGHSFYVSVFSSSELGLEVPESCHDDGCWEPTRPSQILATCPSPKPCWTSTMTSLARPSLEHLGSLLCAASCWWFFGVCQCRLSTQDLDYDATRCMKPIEIGNSMVPTRIYKAWWTREVAPKNAAKGQGVYQYGIHTGGDFQGANIGILSSRTGGIKHQDFL